MKRYLTLLICLLSINIYSQQMGFNVVYVEAEPNSEDNIIIFGKTMDWSTRHVNI